MKNWFNRKPAAPVAKKRIAPARTFHQWKTLVTSNHADARIVLNESGARAIVGSEVCGAWNLARRSGRVAVIEQPAA